MRSAVLILALVVSLAACADQKMGAGASQSSEPATPNPAESGSTAQDPTAGDPTQTDLPTGPIPVEPGQGIGGETSPGRTEAPPFGVSSDTDSGSVPPFTYCWSDPGVAFGICSDGFPNAQFTLSVTDRLVVTYEVGMLTADSSATFQDGPAGDVGSDRSPLPVEMENPGIWLVDLNGLSPGDHAVWLSWGGAQGDSFAALTVTIDR